MKKPRALFVADDFFVLRSTLLPYDVFTGLGAELEAGRAVEPGTAGVATFVRDCERVRARLRERVREPLFEEALAVASRSMLTGLRRWEDAPLTRTGAAAERGLLKYLSRTTTRCTPFGLMSGVGAGVVTKDQGTRLAVGDPHGHRRHVRADAQLVLDLASRLLTPGRVELGLKYYPNSTLYRLGEMYRYYESPRHAYSAEGRLMSVRGAPVLDELIDRSAAGLELEDMIAVVKNHEDEADREEILAFLADVVDSQLLVPDIYPSPLGREMLTGLREKATADFPDHPVHEVIERVAAQTRDQSEAPLGQGATRMLASVEEVLAELQDDTGPVEIDGETKELDVSTLFQVDMALDVVAAQVSRREVDALTKALESVYRVNTHHADERLTYFIETFSRMYGEREVKLSEVLDPDNGIKFGTQAVSQSEPSPLLTIPISAPHAPRRHASQADLWLAKILLREREEKTGVIRLTAEQIGREFPFPLRPAPTSLSIMASRGSVTDADGAARTIWALVQASGCHALTLLARFGHVLGEEFTAQLYELAREEQRLQPFDLVDVCYLPPSRLGNVCQQPGFRNVTIPYRSPVPVHADHVLALDDLLVSVELGKVRLKSVSQGRVIEPRIDHALNYAHATSPAVSHKI